MRIATWNVRGLGGGKWKRKRGRLRQEMHKYVTNGQVDFLLLQEHRLSKAKIENYGSTMSGDWVHFWSPGYGAEENAGGVCIVCGEIWKEKVLDAKVLVCG